MWQLGGIQPGSIQLDIPALHTVFGRSSLQRHASFIFDIHITCDKLQEYTLPSAIDELIGWRENDLHLSSNFNGY